MLNLINLILNLILPAFTFSFSFSSFSDLVEIPRVSVEEVAVEEVSLLTLKRSYVMNHTNAMLKLHSKASKERKRKLRARYMKMFWEQAHTESMYHLKRKW